jgi:hypothetical protein
MDMKKVLLLLFILVLLGSVYAADILISDYQVPTNPPLNQPITITGLYNDANGASGVKCSFYFFDTTGKLVQQATDEYTSTGGRFASSSLILTEPEFQRLINFTAHTECGFASADANFMVAQKQEYFEFFGFALYPQALNLDLLFWTDPENSITFFYEIIAFIIIVMVLSWVVWFAFLRKR